MVSLNLLSCMNLSWRVRCLQTPFEYPLLSQQTGDHPDLDWGGGTPEKQTLLPTKQVKDLNLAKTIRNPQSAWWFNMQLLTVIWADLLPTAPSCKYAKLAWESTTILPTWWRWAFMQFQLYLFGKYTAGRACFSFVGFFLFQTDKSDVEILVVILEIDRRTNLSSFKPVLKHCLCSVVF